MIIDLLRKRRSIRRFQDKPVNQDDIDLLIEAALRSPSSKGINPWEFIVVQDKELIQRLAVAKPHGAAFLKNAPLAIVVCADSSKSDVWVEDASIASLILHLAAADMGLGSCWVQIRLREHNEQQSSQQYVANVLNLPQNIQPVAIIGIGHPMEEKEGHTADTLLHNQVSYDQFDNRR